MAGIVINDKNIGRLLHESQDSREFCFLLIYSVNELGAYSNLAAKMIDRYSERFGQSTSFIRAMFYGTLTYLYSIDFLIKHLSKALIEKMDPTTRTIIRMAVWQLSFSDKVPDFAAVYQAVNLGNKYVPQAQAYINAILRKISDSPKDMLDLSSYKPEIACSLKPEIFGILKKSYGKEKAVRIGKAMLAPNGFSVRYNSKKTTKEAVINAFEAHEITASDGTFCNEAIHISDCGSQIDKTEPFTDGLVFVQNEAAMLASIIANPSPKDKILDLCAAPGGKATHLAQLTEDDCTVIALDINESRIKLIEENTQRFKLNSITCKQADATIICDDPEFSPMLKSFDIVMADVPCSGLGLLARKPDIRRTITYERIQQLLPKQALILQNASRFVKAGGTLIYSTCTLNIDENENRILDFLEKNDDFYLDDISELLPEKLIVDEDRARLVKKGQITLFPDTDLCDGFYICKLKRK